MHPIFLGFIKLSFFSANKDVSHLMHPIFLGFIKLSFFSANKDVSHLMHPIFLGFITNELTQLKLRLISDNPKGCYKFERIFALTFGVYFPKE